MKQLANSKNTATTSTTIPIW